MHFASVPYLACDDARGVYDTMLRQQLNRRERIDFAICGIEYDDVPNSQLQIAKTSARSTGFDARHPEECASVGYNAEARGFTKPDLLNKLD